MAIHYDHGSERLMRLVDQPPQRAVIGLVERLYPCKGVVDRKALAIDFLAVTDHARDGAEPTSHPHRSRIGEARQAPRKHARIEFVGLAVNIDIGAGKVDRHGGKSAIAQAGDQLVHERILGAAQRRKIDPRRAQEFVRIGRSGMRRVEDDRRPPGGRLHNLERARQFSVKQGHCRVSSLESAVLAHVISARKTGVFMRAHCR